MYLINKISDIILKIRKQSQMINGEQSMNVDQQPTINFGIRQMENLDRNGGNLSKMSQMVSNQHEFQTHVNQIYKEPTSIEDEVYLKQRFENNHPGPKNDRTCSTASEAIVECEMDDLSHNPEDQYPVSSKAKRFLPHQNPSNVDKVRNHMRHKYFGHHDHPQVNDIHQIKTINNDHQGANHPERSSQFPEHVHFYTTDQQVVHSNNLIKPKDQISNIRLNQSPLIKNGEINYEGFATPQLLISKSKDQIEDLEIENENERSQFISLMKGSDLFEQMPQQKKIETERYSIDCIFRDPVQEADDDIILDEGINYQRKQMVVEDIAQQLDEMSQRSVESMRLMQMKEASIKFNVQPVQKQMNIPRITGFGNQRVNASEKSQVETVLHSVKSSITYRHQTEKSDSSGYGPAERKSKKRPLEVLYQE